MVRGYNNDGQVWCGCCASYSIHLHIQLNPWLMTQAMSHQIAPTKLRFHSIISIQTWKWLLHVESSLFLFLSHLNINEKYNLSSQPPTLSVKWLVPCKKNWSNSLLLSYFIFIAFSLYLYSIISVQIWKWLLHVKSSLSLFLSHLNINEKYNLSSQPMTLSIKWLVPCKKNWSNSSLLSHFIFIAFSLYLYCM